MKKLLFLAAAAISFSAYAQKSEVKNARNALADKDFAKAQSSIDAAVANPETQSDPAAWHTRSIVYMVMQQQPGNEGKQYYQEALKSLQKVIELKPAYEKEDVNKKLFAIAQYNFNDGIHAFQDKQDFTNSYSYFENVLNIHDIDGGQRFTGNKVFDTIARQAAAYQGYSAYYANRYEEALPLLIKAKTDPIVKDVRNYLMIADIYDSKKDDANLLATINEAKAAYPKDQSVINRELNYYASRNKSEELISRIQEAMKADPTNADLAFNLAVSYDNMANPKDTKGNDLPKPANYAELFKNAETAYENSAKLGPNKADIFYNYGALYYNRGVTVNDEINKLGSSSADIKKAEELTTQRNDWFNKAVPQFEKAIAIWEPQAKKLKGEDFNSYQFAIVKAKEIYARQNNIEKTNEMKKKLEALK